MPTERLVLRLPMPADAPALRDYFVRNDERFARWREARSHELDEHVRWIEQSAAGAGDVTFLAFAKAGSELVAVVSLHAFSVEEPRQAMIAYTVDGAHEGCGLASEAVGRAVQYARDERGVRTLSAHYDPENVRSERLLQRLGFTLVHRTPVIPGFEQLMRVQNVAVLDLA